MQIAHNRILCYRHRLIPHYGPAREPQ
jgi:hypothetical protein